MKPAHWLIVALLVSNLVLAGFVFLRPSTEFIPPARGQVVSSAGEMIGLMDSPNPGSVVIALVDVRRKMMLVYRNIGNRAEVRLASAIDLEKDFAQVGQVLREETPGRRTRRPRR